MTPAALAAAAGAGIAGLVGVVLVVAAAGCAADDPAPAFEAPTARARAAAVAEAASEKDVSAIPDLIAALDDGDPVVRSWAIRALEEITGETLGYDPFAAQGVRDEAVGRWVRWRRRGGETDTVDRGVGGGGGSGPAGAGADLPR